MNTRQSKLLVFSLALIFVLGFSFLFISFKASFLKNYQENNISQWLAKFNDLSQASSYYRKSMCYDKPDRIFPNDLSELHKYSRDCKVLKSEKDWSEFSREISIKYKTYSDLKNDFPEYENSVIGNFVLVDKNVYFLNQRYSIKLFLNGLVVKQKIP